MAKKRRSRSSRALPRSNDRGTAFMRRMFLGIRIQRATGSDDAEVYAGYEKMLEALAAVGKRDTIQAIADGRLSFAEAKEQWNASGANERGAERMPDQPAYTLKARPAMLNWLADSGRAETTQRGYRNAIHQLIEEAGHPDATVAELPSMLLKFRTKCQQRKAPRSFLNAKNAVRSYVKHTIGRANVLYHTIADIPDIEVSTKGRATQTKRKRRLTPEEFRTVVAELPPVLQRAMWAMAATGMNPKEWYEDGWKLELDRVRIYGEKRAGRLRDVPLIPGALDGISLVPRMKRFRVRGEDGAFAEGPDGEPVWERREVYVPAMPWVRGNSKRKGCTMKPIPTASVLGRHAPPIAMRLFPPDERGTPVDLTPYQLRHHFSFWMLRAGIPRDRRRAYLGHDAQDMTDRYEVHEIDMYLREDAIRLTHYLETGERLPLELAPETRLLGPVPLRLLPHVDAQAGQVA